MKVHEVCAEGRAIAEKLRRAHCCEMRDQSAVEFLSERAGEIDKLMNRLAASLDARVAETKTGHPMRPPFDAGKIVVDGKIIDANSVFR